MSEAASQPGFSPESIGAELSPAGNTLTEVLLRRAEATPDAIHLYLIADDGGDEPLTYAQLLQGARAVAAGLAARGVRAGDRVALMLPTGRAFFFSFFGTLLRGAIPVPIYPPMRADQLEDYARRQSAILRNAEVRALVSFREVAGLCRLLKPRVPSLAAVATAEQFAAANAPPGEIPSPGPGEPALIQYTSGSTGDPRGVVLTHGNILANVRAIGRGVDVRPSDVTVCWLPLYHDMGLIGCWLFSLYFGLPIAALSPLSFLRRPERWLRAIGRYRGTLSPAPNFAYELCVRKVKDDALEGLDLSRWRVALNGAEPISPGTLERFTRRYARYGFQPETWMPVYGLAEASVALTFAGLRRSPRIDRVAREGFEREGLCALAAPSDAEALRFVSVGRALPEHEVRIVDDADRPLGERRKGHVQFRGPSTMQGYFRHPDATRAALCGEWCRTGDLGYLADGELFITGRSKDLIIKAGRNIYPQEIEEVAAEVPGVRRGCVAAFSVNDPQTAAESLVVVAETRETNHEARARITSAITGQVAKRARISVDHVRVVSPQALPKTPSGKLRRSECRRRYLEGTLEQARAPVWLQVTRLLASNLALGARHAMGRLSPSALRQRFVASSSAPHGDD